MQFPGKMRYLLCFNFSKPFYLFTAQLVFINSYKLWYEAELILILLKYYCFSFRI